MLFYFFFKFLTWWCLFYCFWSFVPVVSSFRAYRKSSIICSILSLVQFLLELLVLCPYTFWFTVSNSSNDLGKLLSAVISFIVLPTLPSLSSTVLLKLPILASDTTMSDLLLWEKHNAFWNSITDMSKLAVISKTFFSVRQRNGCKYEWNQNLGMKCPVTRMSCHKNVLSQECPVT